MKKIIILIILILITGTLYFYKKDSNISTISSSAEAITAVQVTDPELKTYPSDNLPPKRIETKKVENGWLLGFYMLGSGLPGILKAECYLVTNSGNITSTGEFSAGGRAGPESLDLLTCKP